MKKIKEPGKKLTSEVMKKVKGAWGGGRGYWYMCYYTCEVFYGGCPGEDICPGPCVADSLCP